jgi:hypothetical protein
LYPTTTDERDIYAQEVRYFRLVDAGRFDEAVRFFRGAVVRTADGTWDGERGARTALDRIKLHGGTPRTKHLMSTFDIRVSDGGREAHTLVYVLILQATPEFPLQLIRAMRMADTFAKDGDGWHLVERDESIGTRDGDLTQHLRA